MLTAMAERAPLSRLVGGLALAAGAAQLLGGAAGRPPLGAAFLVDAFFASSLLGAGAIAAAALPRRWRLGALAVGLLLESLFIFVFPEPPDFTQWVVQRGAGVGLAMLGALAIFSSRSAEPRVKLSLRCAAV